MITKAEFDEARLTGDMKTVQAYAEQLQEIVEGILVPLIEIGVVPPPEEIEEPQDLTYLVRGSMEECMFIETSKHNYDSSSLVDFEEYASLKEYCSPLSFPVSLSSVGKVKIAFMHIFFEGRNYGNKRQGNCQNGCG